MANIKIDVDVNKRNIEQSKKSIDSIADSFLSIKTAAAGVAVAGIGLLSKKIYDVTRSFEKYQAVLTNTFGSNSIALKSMQMIQEIAASTPFSVDELTLSYIKLVNRGFKPTREQIIKLGDLASVTGKSFDQLSEAVLDAQTGEFERLKEFGIKMSKNGKTITATFKGQTTSIKNTSDEIQKYILGLGDIKGVSGAMASQSKTLNGIISNLGDNFDSLSNNLGQKLLGTIKLNISSFSTFISKINDYIKTPLSVTIAKDSIVMNNMVRAILDTNVELDKRKELINKLIAEFPQYYGNLNAETLSNKELEEQLKKVNNQLERKTKLQSSREVVSPLKQTLDRNEQIRSAFNELSNLQQQYAGTSDPTSKKAFIELMNQYVEEIGGGMLDKFSSYDFDRSGANRLKLIFDKYVSPLENIDKEIKNSSIFLKNESFENLNKLNEKWSLFLEDLNQFDKNSLSSTQLKQFETNSQVYSQLLDIANREAQSGQITRGTQQRLAAVQESLTPFLNVKGGNSTIAGVEGNKATGETITGGQSRNIVVNIKNVVETQEIKTDDPVKLAMMVRKELLLMLTDVGTLQ
jgi:hypothetical protein